MQEIPWATPAAIAAMTISQANCLVLERGGSKQRVIDNLGDALAAKERLEASKESWSEPPAPP